MANIISILAFCICGAASCSGPNSRPYLQPISSLAAVVGSELVVELRASDDDGDSLDFSVDSPDLQDFSQRASVASHGSGLATFRFVPVAQDIGQRHIDFFVSDGEFRDVESVRLDVEDTEQDTEPTFVVPVGKGTTLDLSSDPCLSLEVVVRDADTVEVAIGLAEAPQAAVVKTTGPQSATVAFCPPAPDLYNLVLTADDGEHDPATKRFYVLATRSKACTPSDDNHDDLYFEQAGCAWGSFCPRAGLKLGPSICVETCAADGDCPAGERCKVFDTKEGCSVAGAQPIGASCEDFRDCEGRAMCAPFSGGYCALSDCSSTGGYSGSCPSGTACVPLDDDRFGSGQQFFCLKRCDSDNDCRGGEGYQCVSQVDDQGSVRLVCL